MKASFAVKIIVLAANLCISVIAQNQQNQAISRPQIPSNASLAQQQLQKPQNGDQQSQNPQSAAEQKQQEPTGDAKQTFNDSNSSQPNTNISSVGVFDFSILNSTAVTDQFTLASVPLDQVLQSSCLNPENKGGQNRVDQVLKESKQFHPCPSYQTAPKSLKEDFSDCVLISNLNSRDLWCPVCSKGQVTNMKCTVNALYASTGHASCNVCSPTSFGDALKPKITTSLLAAILILAVSMHC